jgi:hypothetical protein
MTEPSEIRAGDRVTLRGSDPPKAGRVIEVLDRSAGFLMDQPSAGDAGRVADKLAWVSWEGEIRRTAEQLADLIKLTEE